jgi:hypothetical protein
MKRLVVISLFICSGLALPAWATPQFGYDDWGSTLDSDQTITAIAYFVWSSVEFNDVPVQVAMGVYTDPIYGGEYQHGGLWADIGWTAAMSPDKKIAYVAGPPSTNTTEHDDYGWFAYTLSYNWNTDDPNFDPSWPVYIDGAIYNGPFGSEPIDTWGWRGTPGVPESWSYSDTPYAIDYNPDYTEDFFNNPAPEPATICILGLGALFLRKKRPSKNS